MSQNNNTLFQTPSPPKKRPVPNHDSILEAFRDLGSGVKSTVKNDVAGKIASDAFSSLLGSMPKPGEYKPRNPFERPGAPFRREAPQPIHRPEILSPQRISEEQAHVAKQLDEVRQELAALAKAVGQLNSDVQKAIMEVPVDPGIYHVNFLERLKRTIQIIRKGVQDSSTWLNLSTNRKKQKGYWGSYKKHGTKFGLSADRTPATQTG